MVNARQDGAGIAPVQGKARIEVLDVLRGLAILGILFINVPYMAAPVAKFASDVRSIGWTGADQVAWSIQYLFWSGTQRCVLQFLFAAGMMVIAQKAMTPEGPVAVSDLYYRRNLWLLGFGLVDVFVLLWPGDILHIYALAALFLFPFRRLSPKWLLALGMIWPVMAAVGIPEYGVREYAERTALIQRVDGVAAKLHAGATLQPGDRAAIADWRDQLAKIEPGAATAQRIADEQRAHAGGVVSYVKHQWKVWEGLVSDWLVWAVLEAWCTMMIGVALWKWGVIQGRRDRRFYLALLAGGYGIGLTLRGIGLSEELAFSPGAKTIWFTGEFARIAIGLGHVGLVNFAMQTRAGRAVLEPFKATGRMAFSLYFLQQFIGMWLLFSPFGLLKWGQVGWATTTGIALAIIAFEVLLANLWLRVFTNGLLEWAWRSLSYLRWMPLRRPRAADAGVPAAA
ncbi:MAG: DUF418 domain-containing protein [Sphingomonas sp.]|uniref:DUF418 domain-containing protein n=1 Tax=Sphingomonas sp. TaxID=28214 RepID=UPI001AC01410|nr:DUF418 domain-containing protein [Sphingomonas sp.]MBN8807340.1 DUF418 domain-containing protein [Sphingomonas sp.]